MLRTSRSEGRDVRSDRQSQLRSNCVGQRPCHALPVACLRPVESSMTSMGTAGTADIEHGLRVRVCPRRPSHTRATPKSSVAIVRRYAKRDRLSAGVNVASHRGGLSIARRSLRRARIRRTFVLAVARRFVTASLFLCVYLRFTRTSRRFLGKCFVRSAGGTPVARALIVVRRGGDARRVASGLDGKTTALGLRPGTYVVSASAPEVRRPSGET